MTWFHLIALCWPKLQIMRQQLAELEIRSFRARTLLKSIDRELSDSLRGKLCYSKRKRQQCIQMTLTLSVIIWVYLFLELKSLSHGNFGSVFMSKTKETHLAFQLLRYADIYTSSVENFLRYPLDTRFLPRRRTMPHEPRWALLDLDMVNS